MSHTIEERRGGALARGASKAPTIKIGIVHSLTGPMAQSEGPISEAAVLAVHEINRAGGILGRLIEPLVVDCESNEACFSANSEKLITEEQVGALFGCLTSASRKEVKAVVERHNHLLFYPMQYEGLNSRQISFISAPHRTSSSCQQSDGHSLFLDGVIFSRRLGLYLFTRVQRHSWR